MAGVATPVLAPRGGRSLGEACSDKSAAGLTVVFSCAVEVPPAAAPGLTESGRVLSVLPVSADERVGSVSREAASLSAGWTVPVSFAPEAAVLSPVLAFASPSATDNDSFGLSGLTAAGREVGSLTARVFSAPVSVEPTGAAKSLFFED